MAADLDGAVEHLFPERIGRGIDESTEDFEVASQTANRDEGHAVQSEATGYVQAIDGEGVLAAAKERDSVMLLTSGPGSFVRKGGVLMIVYGGPGLETRDDAALRRLVVIGTERTGTQDIEFFLNQLVELAVRALSPGINDPATARSCIDRLEQAFCALAQRRFPSRLRHGADGALRVIAPAATFGDLLQRTFDELGRYGQSSVSVINRLLEALTEVATCAGREADRTALMRQADAIADRSRLSPLVGADREGIDARYAALVTRLAARGPSPPRERHHPHEDPGGP